MQPQVTVVLATTAWLTVVGLVGGAVTLRLSHDQYSPVSPHRHAGVQQDQTRNWRDHDSVEDQPLDLWIGSRRSIFAEESTDLLRNIKFSEKHFPLEKPVKNIVSSKRVHPFSAWQKRLPNIAGMEFAVDKVDYGYKMPQTLSREAVVPPSDLLDDPFVADDTFQDQGPGSVEIYKLDLSKEKALLTATTPSTNLSSGNKSKVPKKTDHLNSKTKTTEIKSTTASPKIHQKQSNLFEEQRTETPTVNRDVFGVGGVPELQVGCEGLEASSSSHKAKRSIDTPDRKEEEVPASVLLDVVPISLDINYDLDYDEENYEEMDELFRLKNLELTTKKNGPNRGDMDASHLNSDHLNNPEQSEKLPVRGDLGKSTPTTSTRLEIGPTGSQKLRDSKIKNHKETNVKQESVSADDDDGASRSHGRRLLWLAEANTEGFADGKSERKRTRRSIDWGFGENEGVVSSNELQTVNERRRQHEIRYHQDPSRRRDHHHGENRDIDTIRRKYDGLLELKRRENEERLRRVQQSARKTPSRWEEEEERRREELRKKQYEYRNRINYTSTLRMDDVEARRRQIEERRSQEAARNQTQEITKRNEEDRKMREEEERRRRLQEEEMRRRPQNRWQEENLRRSGFTTTVSYEEKRRRLYEEEIKRREEEQRRRLQQEEAKRLEQYRSQQEAQRRKEEEERRHQNDRTKNLSENDRRLKERYREWERMRQEKENERRRQQAPSNLMSARYRISHMNEIKQRDRDEERRMREQEERQREQKLREYIARNQPINVSHTDRRTEEERQRYRPEESGDPRTNASNDNEEYRRQMEEERKLQDYIKRNQPVNVSSRSNQSTAISRRNWFMERRPFEDTRRRDPEGSRHHGPWAPTYIDPRTSPEEVRRRQQETARRLEEERRQRYEAEERRKELARRQQEEEERRQREEEERRLQEERMRKEAARREEETRREQSRRYEENRKRQEEARLQAEKRRQEKERSRSEAGRTRQPIATRPTYYQDPRLLEEHRRRQDSQPVPNNLVRNQDQGVRRVVDERERQRLEAERRRQEESRMRNQRQKEIDQWRQQEYSRLNSLPVNARIIVRPGGSLLPSPFSPTLLSRGSFDNEIDFTGINPHREGVQAAKFPAPPTPRPPAQSPGPCVWAVVQCCSPNNDRLVKCFESMGCPGVNWDPNPCKGSIAEAARAEVMKFYANQ